jgi:hypothetical protein
MEIQIHGILWVVGMLDLVWVDVVAVVEVGILVEPVVHGDYFEVGLEIMPVQMVVEAVHMIQQPLTKPQSFILNH